MLFQFFSLQQESFRQNHHHSLCFFNLLALLWRRNQFFFKLLSRSSWKPSSFLAPFIVTLFAPTISVYSLHSHFNSFFIYLSYLWISLLIIFFSILFLLFLFAFNAHECLCDCVYHLLIIIVHLLWFNLLIIFLIIS